MKFSIAKTCINPLIPSYLSGQINRIEKHTGILDDLFCTTIIIEENQTKICLLAYDLLQFDSSLSDAIRIKVADKLNIDTRNVFTIPSHTHAAPEVLKDGLFGIKTESSVAEGYLDYLTNKSIDNSVLANETLKNVDLEYGEIEIDGIYGNRNDKNRLADKKIRFLMFKDKNKVVGILVNLSCHPTILGQKNTMISADLFGYIRSHLEDRYHCPVFMSNGTEGDVSNRHYRISDDINELIRTGNGIISQIPYPLPTSLVSINRFEIHHRSFEFKCFNDIIRLRDAISRNNQLILDTNNPDQLKILHATNTVLNHQINQTYHERLTIEYSIIELGSMIIITVPLELFSSLYLKLEYHNTIIFGLTNTSYGYCVDKESYDNTYEGLTSLFIKGEGERFISHLNEEIKQIQRINASI